MEESTFKICSKCKTSKKIDDFYRSGKSKDGHRAICKSCENKQIKKWQLANKSKVLGYFKKYHDTHKDMLREKRQLYDKTRVDREKKNSQLRKYYHANKDRFKTYMTKYRHEHHEELLAKKRAYYWAHREERAETNRLWREVNHTELLKKKRDYGRNHPEVGFRHTQRRRAQKKTTQIEIITRHQWEFIKSIYGYRCVYCGKKTIALQQDHILALASGGSHTLENIVPACGPCNQRKGTRKVPMVQIVLPDLIRGLGA